MVKHAYSLKVPKKAKDSLDFLCEGFHLVREALKSGIRCRFIFATKDGWNQPEGKRIYEEAQREKVRCFEIAPKIVSYLADTVTPQGMLAVAAKPEISWPQDPFSLVLAVHRVQDAGNMGTLFRSAEAFGAQALFLSEGCCDPFNPKAVRASMGSLFRTRFMSGQTWENYMEWFEKNKFHTYALTMEGSDRLPEINFRKPTALWVGAEGAGLPEDLIERCSQKVGIPMAGKVESLNVGVAASLALYRARFQDPVS